MGLKQYSNIEQIESTRKAIEGLRFDSEDLGVFQKSIYQYKQVELTSINSANELHVYSGDQWITGKQKIDLKNYSSPIFDKDGNEIQLSSPVSFDISQELLKLKLTSGNFKIILNFFENVIGSYNQQHLAIDEISPDRTEVRLKAINERNPAFLLSINNYINNVQQTSLTSDPYNCYLLNFSRNQTVKYVNSVVVGKYLFVKLYKPLDRKYKKNFKCWIVREKKNPYIDNIQVTEKILPSKFNILQGTNWYASAEQETSNATSLKAWNDLLGSSLQTSQQIIDNYFSGSLGGIKLNIDYTDFNNFVFYSSAAERVSNLKYKLELLEYYSQQSSSISQLSGSIAESNALENNILSSNLIGGFDDFEKFLYYESSSGLFNNDVPVANPTVAEITGSYITPIPKSNDTRPYEIASVTSSAFETWYAELFDKASIYDNRNNNRIIRAVPEFMLLDENNEQLSTFVNMLGQHYDILYTYINSMTLINSREEHPKLGMPNELLYSVAKQFGWKLTNGAQSEDLWKYTLGTDEFGTPLTGSNSVGDASPPLQDVTFATWRRIVNNIPGLLKTKGTKRSIQALLACYGIPQSLITIQEYGGPRIKRPPRYEKHNFDYSLDLLQNTAGTVEVPYDTSVNTGIVKSAQLRFRTANVLDTPTLPGTMNVFSVGGHDVTITFTRGTLGTISINNGTPSEEIELYDGEYTTALLRQKDSSNLEVLAKRSKFGKIVATVSASAPGVFALPSDGSLAKMLVGGTAGGVRLQGQVQELRLWSSSLADAPYTNHTKAPSAYDGNVDAYDELIYRAPLTQRINHAETASIGGVQPNQFLNTIQATFTNWTNDIPYDSVEETYFSDGISLGAGTYDDNKIRLESTVTSSFLNTENKVATNEFDSAPLDSEQLGVFYSPQTMINEDIIAQLGFTLLDDLIGDPSNNDPYAYPDLVNTSREYWKKYVDRNDMNAYLRIFSLFDLSFFKQVEQLLPARADKTLGVLVQPNILERSRDKVLARMSRESLTFEGSLNIDDEELQAETKQLEPVVDVLEEFITGSTRQLEPIIDIPHNRITGSTIQLEPQVDMLEEFITASKNDLLTKIEVYEEAELLSGSTRQLEPLIEIYDESEFFQGSTRQLEPFIEIYDESELLSGSTRQLEPIIETDISKLSSSYGDLFSKLLADDIYLLNADRKDLETFLIKEQKVIEADTKEFNSILIGNANPFDGAIYSRKYLLFDKDTEAYDITGSTPYWESEALSPAISASRLSEFRKIQYDFPFTPPLAYGFGGNGSQTLDTSQWTTKNIIQQPTTTGIAMKKAGPITGSGAVGAINNWNANIMHNTVFLRKDSPFIKLNFKSVNIGTGTIGNHPLPMIGWYPKNSGSAGDGNNTPFTSYTSNLYVLYQQGDRFLVYNGGSIAMDPLGRLNVTSNALLSSITDVNIGAPIPVGGTYKDVPLIQSANSTGTGKGAYADISVNGSGNITNLIVNVYNPNDNRALEANDGSNARGVIFNSEIDSSNATGVSNGAIQISGVDGSDSGTGAVVRVVVSNVGTGKGSVAEYEITILRGGENFEVGETVSVADSGGTRFEQDIEFEVTADMLVGTVNNGMGSGYKSGDKLTCTGFPMTTPLEIVLNSGDVTFTPIVDFKGDDYIQSGDEWTMNLMARPDGGAELSVIDRSTGNLAFTFDNYVKSLVPEMRFGVAFYQANSAGTLEFQDLTISTSRGLGYELRPAEYQDYEPRGMLNAMFDGTKISSPDFNVKSKDTPDGKPVVEITETDGNKVIVTKSPGTKGNFEVR